VAQLKPLHAIAALRLLSHNIENRIDELSALSVMTLSPIVSCSSLSKHEVIWPEKLSERTSSHTVHCTWLKIHENCTWDIATTSRLVEIYVNAFELQVGITVVGSSRINAMLVRNDLGGRTKGQFLTASAEEAKKPKMGTWLPEFEDDCTIPQCEFHATSVHAQASLPPPHALQRTFTASCRQHPVATEMRVLVDLQETNLVTRLEHEKHVKSSDDNNTTKKSTAASKACQ
jgi:hypothetical protein